jgi:hypothetical protein
MKQILAALFAICCVPAACAADCGDRIAVETTSDIPGAISYDVYSQLQPATLHKLAIFTASQQVRFLAAGTQACEISDDGVADSSAVLLRVPGKSVNLWVPRHEIRELS